MSAKIIVADQPPIPLSCIYPGICVAINVIWKPQTKKPALSKRYPLWVKASLSASKKVWSFTIGWFLSINFFGANINNETIDPNKIKYISKESRSFVQKNFSPEVWWETVLAQPKWSMFNWS